MRSSKIENEMALERLLLMEGGGVGSMMWKRMLGALSGKRVKMQPHRSKYSSGSRVVSD